MIKPSPRSLAYEIRKNIGLRVFICCVFLLITLAATFSYSYRSLTTQLDRKLKYIEADLTPYIISQKLIGGRYAVDIKFSELEKSNNFTIELNENKNTKFSGLIIHNFFRWTYYVPITSRSNENFGFYTIHGSFLTSDFFLDTLLIDGSLLLVFLLLVIFVLYPIASYVPRNIIVKPVAELLQLLQERTPGTKISLSGPTEIVNLKRKIISLLENERSSLEKESFFKLSKQVAHDIRSPLAALEVSIKNLSTLPEEQALLIKNATRQIKDISNNLLQSNSKASLHNCIKTRGVMLIPIVEYVLSEKNAELSKNNSTINITSKIDSSAYKVFINASPLELRRILSNILNNSIEAIERKEKGEISVSISCIKNMASIVISDNGSGIPHSISKNIFNEGVSTKKTGSGLGLHHAKTFIEKWNGSIDIEPNIVIGTNIKIRLPLYPVANWFLNKLTIPNGYTLIVVDDSPSIFNLWQERISTNQHKSIQVKYFSDPDVFLEWYKGKPDFSHYIYLIDYEFTNNCTNGIDVINKLNTNDQKILVTSYAEDAKQQEECLNLKIKLLPKFFISHVPFNIVDRYPEVIVIEPDISLQKSYLFRANKRKIPIIIYDSANDFYADFRFFDVSLNLYISDEFINEIQFVKNLDFMNVIITTSDIKKYAHISSVMVTEKHSFLTR